MKICIEYNGRWVEMDKPDHNYGSNIETFREIAHLAFAAVELELIGEINEIDPNRPPAGFSKRKILDSWPQESKTEAHDEKE